MEDSIKNFSKQFDFEPEIENGEKLNEFENMVFCGMGGSHLAADLLKTIKPGINIYVHKDYDLPPYDEDFLNKSLLVACSYSGNTEEVLSFVSKSIEKDLNLAIISRGGELLDIAKEREIPFIELPDDDIQPRMAIGYIMISICKLLSDDETISKLNLMTSKIKPEELKEKSLEILDIIEDKIPVIYSSTRNLHIANNWKIKLNETAKIPAFYNVFPELNHNEMQSFDTVDGFKNIFVVVFLFDSEDDARIQKRMDITKELYDSKGISTLEFNIGGKTREENVLNAILSADWISMELAKKNNFEPESVPMIEEFKEKMRE